MKICMATSRMWTARPESAALRGRDRAEWAEHDEFRERERSINREHGHRHRHTSSPQRYHAHISPQSPPEDEDE